MHLRGAKSWALHAAALVNSLKADEEDRKSDHTTLVQVKEEEVATHTATETNLQQGGAVVKEEVATETETRGRCCSAVASLVTVFKKTHHLPSGHVCSVELVKGLGCGRRNFPRSAAQWGLQLECCGLLPRCG